MSHLDELNRWDPEKEELPEHLVRALNTDAELRAAFDARFPPLNLDVDFAMPEDLARRIRPPNTGSGWGWLSTGLVIGVALAASVLLVMGLLRSPWQAPEIPDSPPHDPPVQHGEAPPLFAAAGPLASLPLAVGGGSYRLARDRLADGALPPPDTVQAQSFVNALPYTDPVPQAEPFAVTTEAVASPWKAGTLLVRIAVQGRQANPGQGNPGLLARAAEADVEWDPKVVVRHHLVGTEDNNAAAVPGRLAEVEVGHRVTALYEVQLVQGGTDASFGVVRLRHTAPDAAHEAPLTERTWPMVVSPSTTWSQASHDLRLTVALAAFAEKLRGAIALDWSEVLRLARDAARSDHVGEVELVRMVETAAGLAGP